ncbi:MAG: hypothetical protein IPK80_35350 [Nannocystis sp.]|nr:hypothetical protein [Nannocystis sp.]MBK8266589.1 hypothetical protein [Nannocystis sp.]
MPRLPDLLRLLTRDELLAAADRLGVALPERRAKDPIVEALAAAPAATPEAVLANGGEEEGDRVLAPAAARGLTTALLFLNPTPASSSRRTISPLAEFAFVALTAKSSTTTITNTTGYSSFWNPMVTIEW